MNFELQQHHYILIAIVVGFAYWKGYIKLPSRKPSAPPQLSPLQQNVAAGPSDVHAVLASVPPDLLGKHFARAKREQAAAELDQAAAETLGATIVAAHKAPFSPPSDSPAPPTGS